MPPCSRYDRAPPTFTPTPPLRLDTPRFTLRAWSADDAAALRQTLAASDAHLRAFTPWVVDGRVPGRSLESRLAQHAADFATGAEWVYGMFSLRGAEVLGGCGLYPRVGPRAIEIGYWLSVGHIGRGLATQASAALTQLAFAMPGIDQVDIRIDPRNSASARIPHRLGYTAQRIVPDGIDEPAATQRHDTVVTWRLTRPDFAETRTTFPHYG